MLNKTELSTAIQNAITARRNQMITVEAGYSIDKDGNAGIDTITVENCLVDSSGKSSDAAMADAIAEAIVEYLEGSLEVVIPSNTYIESVTGQAVGLPNVTPKIVKLYTTSNRGV